MQITKKRRSKRKLSTNQRKISIFCTKWKVSILHCHSHKKKVIYLQQVRWMFWNGKFVVCSYSLHFTEATKPILKLPFNYWGKIASYKNPNNLLSSLNFELRFQVFHFFFLHSQKFFATANVNKTLPNVRRTGRNDKAKCFLFMFRKVCLPTIAPPLQRSLAMHTMYATHAIFVFHVKAIVWMFGYAINKPKGSIRCRILAVFLDWYIVECIWTRRRNNQHI